MNPDRFFCAEAARARDEHRYATAPRIASWLLLEHPGAWSSAAFPDDRLPEPVRERIASLSAALPRNRRLLIRQTYGHPEVRKCFVIRTGEKRSHAAVVPIQCYEDLLSFDAAALWHEPAERVHTGSLFLVCTHGKHDKCCSRFGFATFRALRESAGDSAWQCTHVGGDRFAANIVCLPEGIYYGHVQPEEAADIVAAHRSRRISLRHYRGRTCYGRAAQAAEYFVRRESGLSGLDDLRMLDKDEVSPGVYQCRFVSEADSFIHEVSVGMHRSSAPVFVTCHSDRADTVREFALAGYTTYPVESDDPARPRP